ncbi:uncharacterized protein LACBIDRAFT_327503 [Laccaria bicolor S238N-H82]|uniref:Predicted protein n=1 Tax=Laccaria bicolor (strain S238N-H82 / ATCC MYA-4686) TaxID=486041 RepID=B0DBX5_LACBS|nr:uncharacterized protein LACBIDRAFT_327503 [Laccaria bicolor S238N-H82]EDR07636.1 predicted protein [Laccaria bicolor S238N-H82]|eukprot:XP_001881425.1 predicted protein [Laccaria bicolor S238N-H82]
MYLSSGSSETNPLPQNDRRLKVVQSKTALEVERLVSKSYILRPTPLPRSPSALQSPSPSGSFSVSEEKASSEIEHKSPSLSHFKHADERVLHANSTLPRSHSDHKPRPTSLNASFSPPKVYDLSSITPSNTSNFSSSEKDVLRKRVIKLRKMLGEDIHPELLNPSQNGENRAEVCRRWRLAFILAVKLRCWNALDSQGAYYRSSAPAPINNDQFKPGRDEKADFVDSSPSSLKRSYRPLSRALDSQRITPKYRPRFASLPHPIPSELQAQIDIDNDRIARGLASPPLTDFSTFEDTYRGPRGKGFEGLFAPSVEPKIKPILKRNRSLSAGVSNAQKTFSPLNLSSDRKPDPRRIVAALEQVLNLGPQDVGEHLDIHELLGMHQLDQLNFEERDAIRSQTFHGGRQAMQDLTVFGEHLRKVSIYASISVVLGGRDHELPVVVVSAVEELYRTGIYQHNLFRTLPNRARLLQLISIFDSQRQPAGEGTRHRIPSGELPNPPSGFGADTSLHLESTPDICALLSTYLASLPEPILLPTLFRAVWDWCGVAEENNDLDGPHRFSSRLIATQTHETDSTRIKTAQLLLHLLPSPNFSLLVYLLSFFSQVVLVREENGLGVEDVGRMFGGRIFGGGTTRKHHGSGGERRREGETMMCWFMNRWGTISEGLFNVVEELTSRKESGDVQVKTANGSVGTSGQTPKSASSGDFGGSPSTSPSTLNLPFIRPLEIGKGSSSQLPPSASGTLPVNDRHSPPKRIDSMSDGNGFKVGNNRPLSAVENRATSPPEADAYHFWGNRHAETSDRKLREPNKVKSASLNDRLDVYSAQDISSEAASINSAPALEERLLDISPPSETEDTNQEPSSSASTPRPSSAQTNPELSQALSHILSLELKLKMSELLIEESAQENAKATEKVLALENRVKELELQVKGGDGARMGVGVGADVHEDGDGCGQLVGSDGDVVSRTRLETALGERDTARRLVADIKDLIEHKPSV